MYSDEEEINFREIAPADIPSVAALLARGFPRRQGFWPRALDRLGKHPQPAGFPKYGYVIEQRGRHHGVLLTIYSRIREGDGFVIRCNPCAWYVDAPFRAYAGLLFAKALKDNSVTYVNVTPAPHTRAMLEALGFRGYCSGMFVAIPILKWDRDEHPAVVFDANQRPSASVDPMEQELLLRHAAYGCISLWCATKESAYPFVFQPRLIKGWIPCVQIVYCRAVEDFVRLAAPLGRFLARRGMFFVIADANEPLPGLVGIHRGGGMVRYFRGPQRPHLCDLADTELAVLGV